MGACWPGAAARTEGTTATAIVTCILALLHMWLPRGREIVRWLALGKASAAQSATEQGSTVSTDALLAAFTPAAQHLHWLLLRLSLDQQVPLAPVPAVHVLCMRCVSHVHRSPSRVSLRWSHVSQPGGLTSATARSCALHHNPSTSHPCKPAEVWLSIPSLSLSSSLSTWAFSQRSYG